MAIDYRPQTVPASEYERIFELERQHNYPSVDGWEKGIGFALDRAKLEEAGRVLSCPFKAAPPNWQQGRVIYATYRHYLQHVTDPVNVVDIGTAKGFSALCALWALRDAGATGTVTSVDVMPPEARIRRSTIAEVDHLCTLREILEPWPESQHIDFCESTGIDWLTPRPERVHLAFVDGKHTYDVVRVEAKLLAKRQQSGDITIFDDTQMAPVGKAVKEAAKYFDLRYIHLGSVNRQYAIGVRK